MQSIHTPAAVVGKGYVEVEEDHLVVQRQAGESVLSAASPCKAHHHA